MDRPGARTEAPSSAGLHAADAGILADITADLASGRDLEALLRSFLEPIIRLAGAQAGAVRLLADSEERLRLVSEIGLPPAVHASEEAVDRHCGICGIAADGGRMVSSSDLGRCSARGGAAFFGQACRRLVAVPLQHRGRVLGVYNLFFAAEAEPAPPIMALLKSIGELLGLALDNARLEAENLRVTVMQERQSMAAEVHDSVAQTLTFAKMRMPLLQDALIAHDEARALKYLGDVRQALGDAHASLREIVTHFRKRVDPRGLAPALDALVARFRARAGIELSYVQRMGRQRMSSEVETDAFHIAQEALANIERHSRARHAWLSAESDARSFELRIEDDGIGPLASDEQCDESSHFGIGIMSERAHRMGGELSVTRRAGGGTLVRLTCPFASAGRPGAMP
jgi:two-component system, NarL family, nitrate/nitrite sensor histidine kinase NarX